MRAFVEGFAEEHCREETDFGFGERAYDDKVELAVSDRGFWGDRGVVAELGCIGKGDHKRLLLRLHAVGGNGVFARLVFEV